MKIKRIHLGEFIREKVEQTGISKAEFARKIGLLRQNIEKTVFMKNSLDTDLLCRISEELDYNFFELYKNTEHCNTADYITPIELKAKITIEMGAEKQEKTYHFEFGKNNIEIKDK